MANKGQKCTPVDSPEARAAFLEALRELGSIYSACQRVEISRTTIYTWMADDSDFAAEVDAAKHDSCDTVISTLRSRALLPWDGEVKYASACVNAAKLFLSSHGVITDSSKSQIEHSGNVGIGGLAELAQALAAKRGNDDET